MSAISRHLRSNLVGYIALFFALGLGSAWAATELGKNDVKSKHIKNGQVKKKDLAAGSVDSAKVADGGLLGEDFAPGQLPQGERGLQGEPGLQGESGLQGERGLQGEPGRDGILDAVGRSGYIDGFCLPGEYTFPDPAECASTSLTLARSARVLLVAEADWGLYGGGAYAGECKLTVDSVPISGGPVTEVGERDVNDVGETATLGDLDFLGGGAPPYYMGHTGLTYVTDPLDAGTHSFGLLCGQTDDVIAFKNSTISALAISPN